MKRNWLLVALFLLLGAGAYYAVQQKNKKTGSRSSWDMDFAVQNPQEIARIFLADRSGQTATLERMPDGRWQYNSRYAARRSAVELLIETMASLNVLYIPPKAAEAAMVKSLAAEGIKVEVYDKNGQKLKIYYVGGVTNDERGTYMIMDGAEQPYVVHVPSFIGQLRVRYLLGDDNWRDRSVFAEKPEDIRSIAVQYPQQKSESFLLEKTGTAAYTVRPYFSTTPIINHPQRKGVAEAYLLKFEQLGAEAFETGNPARDSVSALVPFAIVTVKKTDGTEKTARFWPVSVDETRSGAKYVVRYFTDLNNGESFLLTQDHVFGPIFRSYAFFYESAEKKRLPN